MLIFNKKLLNNLFLRVLLKIIPVIERSELINYGKKNNSICIVEKAYNHVIPEPKHSLAKKRFKDSSGLREIDCFFGVCIKDVRLVGPYGLPITNQGKIILEPIHRKWIKRVLEVTIQNLGIYGFIKQYFFALFPFIDVSESLNFGAYLFCRASKIYFIKNKIIISPVFGHWMTEQMPQIRGIEAIIKKFKIKDFKIITNDQVRDWQIESLQMMGYDRDKILTFKSNGIKVKNLIISSLRNTHSKSMEFDPKARNWAADRLKANFNNKNFDKNSYKNIGLFRQEVIARRINNIQAVRSVIKKKGFKEISIVNRTLQDSSKDFYRAEKLIATYGGGISRVMFSKNLKELIEIYSCDQEKLDVDFLLASEFDVNYRCILAKKLPNKSIESHQKNFLYNDHELYEWNVPINDLMLELEE